MKRIITLVAVTSTMVLGFTACDGKGSSYSKLQASYDSLLVQNTRSQQELEGVLGLIMDVETEINKVNAAENKLRMGQARGEFSENDRQQLLDDIRSMTSSLEESKSELAKKLDELKKKDINISSLNKKISQLQQQIVQKENTIAQMTAALASRDSLINVQGAQISDLNETKGMQETTIALQDRTIASQDKRLHTAYYCFGTNAELKEQGIIKGGGLFSRTEVLPEGYNKDYMMRIDIREVDEIPLFAPKAKLLTDHPSSSYDLIKDGNKNLILKIKNTESFWSRGKNLVVEVIL
ncbi:hypothetical protein [Porphyromonas levii]|uniref:Lipoprotein n=1 Tax=Porphyromonas levii TaxID=28114 RepID=A0A4Y8WNW4_9PORP|nr:hypothetical protein [Porphyromonas levii]MBR8703977.1 hypothetical protein [Porphyromonas levii]MBR8713805.1 hypothetical protein [Porphyromonas levii]MBR8715813.1 hypothetical protein [Porphyromonas levii]MBR8728361.1 hypothetical protein [Porphyromonas levii]MBR8729393.1 hypothetical protein [Porphyromonas levii]